jgi:hypothetical protein
MPTRRLALTALFLFGAPSIHAQVDSTTSAWGYLTDRNSSLQWVIISSKRNNGYVQCENVRTFVRCEFPVWAKILPGERRTKPVGLRGSAYPDVSGAKLNEYLSGAQLAALKKTLARMRIKPEDVHSQAVNPRGAVVGTSYDVAVVLELAFEDFDRFVTDVLMEVFQAPPKQYNFEIGRWSG